VLRAVENPPDFLVEEFLGIAPLGPDIGDQWMTRAVLARQIGFVLGDVGILRTQFVIISEEMAALMPPGSPPDFAMLLTC
jgi:hypothetical protein